MLGATVSAADTVVETAREEFTVVESRNVDVAELMEGFVVVAFRDGGEADLAAMAKLMFAAVGEMVKVVLAEGGTTGSW